jgi:hypothetical protein
MSDRQLPHAEHPDMLNHLVDSNLLGPQTHEGHLIICGAVGQCRCLQRPPMVLVDDHHPRTCAARKVKDASPEGCTGPQNEKALTHVAGLTATRATSMLQSRFLPPTACACWLANSVY